MSNRETADIVLRCLKEKFSFSTISVLAYENGREHGHSLALGGYKVSFSENRNSDHIVVYFGRNSSSDFDEMGVPSEGVYRKKKFFDPEDFEAAADFIAGFLLLQKNKQAVKRAQEVKQATAVCLTGCNGLTEGQEYEIQEVCGDLVIVKTDQGEQRKFMLQRFSVKAEIQPEDEILF